ncbi:MAG: DNA internalization-related competence protein ComEC/Rec2 [Desulfosoma sp.]
MGVRVSVRTVLGSWKAGDVVDMPLTLRPLTNFENPGRYDYVADQARRGLHARASSKSDIFWVHAFPPGVGSAAVGAIHRGIDAVRQHFRRLIEENIHGPPGAVAQALFLGYRNAVPPSIQDRFQKAGVMHLLAISGLHVGLAAWAAFRVAQILLRLLCPGVLLRIPDVHLAWWAGCAAATAYALMAGLAVPTQRALILLISAAAALVLYRKPDPLNLLATAGILILLLDPNNLFRPSFQLSFAAFLGIVLAYAPWSAFARKKIGKLPRRIRWAATLFADAFLLSAAATLTAAPLTAYHFHSFSAAGLAANTVIVPFLALAVLPPGLAALALGALVPPAAPVLLLPVGWTLELLLWLIEGFAAFPLGFAHVGPVPVWGLVAFYTAAAVSFLPVTPKKKILGMAVVMAFVAGFSLVRHLHGLSKVESLFQVTALDVGQGSATVIRCPEGAAILVDGGGFYDDSFDVGRHVVAPALWAMGIRRLDTVVLSHDHPDHRNGLRFILETFPVGRYVETGITSRGLEGSALSAVAARRRIPIVHTLMDAPQDADGTVDLGPVGHCRIRSLHPTPAFIKNAWDGKDLNEVSLVLEVTCGDAGILLPGDIGQETERILLEKAFPKSLSFSRRWVLIAPHHGSAGSCSRALLETLRPDAVLISCGPSNPFGFPAPAVLDRIQALGIPVLRTDLHGAVHAAWDGSRWRWSTMIAKRQQLYTPALLPAPKREFPAKRSAPQGQDCRS